MSHSYGGLRRHDSEKIFGLSYDYTEAGDGSQGWLQEACRIRKLQAHFTQIVPEALLVFSRQILVPRDVPLL